ASRRSRRWGDRAAGHADLRPPRRLRARLGPGRARAPAGDPVVRARHGGEGRGGVRPQPGGDGDHALAARRRSAALGRPLPLSGLMADRFRAAALAYFVYGVVYLVGGLYLIYRGVGVMGAPTSGATAATLARWGLIGLIPLIVIPWFLGRRWSWMRGWVSRRTFAVLVAVLLAIRAFKVGAAAVHPGARVAAPWGGEITFQAGAVIFLVVTLMALVFVARAAASRA